MHVLYVKAILRFKRVVKDVTVTEVYMFIVNDVVKTRQLYTL